jgi:hypothetical protein
MRPERRPWGRDLVGSELNSLPPVQIQTKSWHQSDKSKDSLHHSFIPATLYFHLLHLLVSHVFHRAFDRTDVAASMATEEYIMKSYVL